MSSGDRTMKADLARFMDPQAFEPVPQRVGKAKAKAMHDARKIRREIATKRADAAIRFFLKPGAIDRLTYRATNPAASQPQAEAHTPARIEAAAGDTGGGL